MGDFNIQLDAGSRTGTVSGVTRYQIGQAEADAFGIGDQSTLRSLISRSINNNPVNGAWLHDPTSGAPCGDMFGHYGWDPVLVTLQPIRVDFTGITPSANIAASASYHNGDDHPNNWTASATATQQETSSNSWSNSNSVSVGQKISYDIGIPGIEGVEGETSFSYTHTWGQTKTETHSITVSMGSSVTVSVPAHSWETAYVWGQVGHATAKVTYEATLSGGVCFITDFRTPNSWWGQGHRDHWMGIGFLDSLSGYSTTKIITENVDIGFYTHLDLYTEPGPFNPNWTPPAKHLSAVKAPEPVATGVG
ncbi:hypothetical protein ACW9HR_36360 [Nocardia gipuzkoensis]